MLKWLSCKLDQYYAKKYTQRKNLLIKKQIQEFKQKWANTPIELKPIGEDLFMTIGDYKVYNSSEFTLWFSKVHEEYYFNGICNVFWSVSEDVLKDDFTYFL